jgi:ribosomal protein L11
MSAAGEAARPPRAEGNVVPAVVTGLEDRSFLLRLKTSCTAFLIRKGLAAEHLHLTRREVVTSVQSSRLGDNEE